jgi:hypothetical protein
MEKDITFTPQINKIFSVVGIFPLPQKEKLFHLFQCCTKIKGTLKIL